MNFIEQKFFVSLVNLESDKKQTIFEDGFVAEDTGLGYYLRGDDTYVVTHLASGFEAQSFYSEDDARAAIEALAPLIDWHQSVKIFFEDAKLVATIKQTILKVIQYDRSRMVGQGIRTEALIQKAREIAEA